jgi:glycine/D-amino acid oxidase-like deaminating enzyme
MAATHPMRLRSGRSIWQSRRLPTVPHKNLTRDLATEVLVIGAGISGAVVADALSEAGLTVLIVDRRGPVAGSTAASTALLQYEIDTPLSKLAKRIGRERAERIWRRSRLALEALRARARHLGIDANCIERDSLYLQGDVLDEDALREEADARRRAGLEVAFLTARQVKERFGITRRAAILGYHNLTADPRRLAAGFLRAALGRGAKLLSPVKVLAVDPQRGAARAATEGGPVIRARHIVFATGYELPKGVPRKGHTIASTWALATRPQPSKLWPERCTIWEASDPYLYLRVGPDGRIICGGEDEDFSDEDTRDAMMDSKIASIEAKLARLLPRVDPGADFAWCGSFGGSKTGTPSIGPVPGMPNCYAVLGYGGNGITFSMMAAQILRGMIAGNGDPDSDLFSFSRKF